MIMAINKIAASIFPQEPLIATFALMGPITQSKKAEKEPKKPIIALNSGIRIDTPTAVMVSSVRSMVIPAFLNASFLSLTVLVRGSSCAAGGGALSSPRRASRVAFSGRVNKPNFDLCFRQRQITQDWSGGLQW